MNAGWRAGAGTGEEMIYLAFVINSFTSKQGVAVFLLAEQAAVEYRLWLLVSRRCVLISV